MNEDLEALRKVIQRLPARIALPLAVFLYYASLSLYVAFLPLGLIYRSLLLPMVWIEWEKQRKQVLLIYSGSDHSRQWMDRLKPLLGEHAVLLDWSERKNWDAWSLPVLLFEAFGPDWTPQRFTGKSLPAVIVFRKLHQPKVFAFGERTKDREEKLQRLRAALELSFHPVSTL